MNDLTIEIEEIERVQARDRALALSRRVGLVFGRIDDAQERITALGFDAPRHLWAELVAVLMDSGDVAALDQLAGIAERVQAQCEDEVTR